MAYKNSELLSLNEKYKLGKYEFSLETRSIPQTQLMDVIAKATGPAGKMGAKTIQIPQSTEIEGWYVDANSTTADVYLKGKEAVEPGYSSDLDTSPVEQPIPTGDEITVTGSRSGREQTRLLQGRGMRNFPWYLVDQISDGYRVTIGFVEASTEPFTGSTTFTHNGKMVYYNRIGLTSYWDEFEVTGGEELSSSPTAVRKEIAWTLMYGDESGTGGDILVGRFAIDIRVAGGTAGNGGEENGWEDPDDGQPTLWPGDEGYPDPEDPDYPGDDEPYYPPSKTLYLEIDGALSGRHNDPLHDTSYSYIPADKATVKPYGYGGDGGHGGGGGGGASTVIVYKFATDKADSKEITVKPKRHGYGSGGGKGGKGGDGCILIYY